jgi:hypothetical protein
LDLALDMASPAGQYVDTVVVTPDTGVITATMQAAGVVGADIAGATVTLTPPALGGGGGAAFVWDCDSSAAQKYLPKGCDGA